MKSRQTKLLGSRQVGFKCSAGGSRGPCVDGPRVSASTAVGVLLDPRSFAIPGLGQSAWANAFYVLFCYLGGAAGITLSGHAYHLAGWPGVVALAAIALLVPLGTGVIEMRAGRRP